MEKSTVAQNPRQTTINREVAVRSIYPSRLKYIGAISGKEYQWVGAGDTVMVLADDVPYLLSKRIGGRGCCGATRQNGNQVFEI